MDIKLRGWGRDMGTRVVVSHDLPNFRISDDPKQSVGWRSPGLFSGGFGGVSVSWGQTLKLTGDYRVQIDFTQADVFKVFKASYGAELDVDLLDEGFSISDALKKKILSEIKLADLTIGDLAKLGAVGADPKPEVGTVKPFIRRI